MDTVVQKFATLQDYYNPVKKEGFNTPQSNLEKLISFMILWSLFLVGVYVLMKLYNPSVQVKTIIEVVVASSIAGTFMSMNPKGYLILNILALLYIKFKKL
jgi:hypothetical protein